MYFEYLQNLTLMLKLTYFNKRGEAVVNSRNHSISI